METEILKSPEAAREALLSISNTLSQFNWPSKEEKVKWTIVYESLISKNKINIESNPSESKLVRLHKLMEEYFTNHDFDCLAKYSRDFKLICLNLDNAKLYNPPITDVQNVDKLNFFLSDLQKRQDIRNKSFFLLLSVHLKNKDGNEYISRFLDKNASFFSKADNANIYAFYTNKELYLRKNVLLRQIIATDAITFEESLKKLPILENFIHEKFQWFYTCYFEWVITRRTYSHDFLIKNIEKIKSLYPDQIKIIEAYIIINSEESNISFLIDKLKMKSADSETYWHLNNPELEKKYKTVLIGAYEILRTMITRDFINLVFKYLGDKTDLDAQRLSFWIKYAGRIISFKLFLPDQEKRYFKYQISNITNNSIYTDILEVHSLRDRGNNPTGAIALIMQFDNLIVAEFPKTGKPIQIYQSNNSIITKLFDSKTIYTDLEEIQQYKDIEGERYSDNYSRREGSLAHRGNWQGPVTEVLHSYRIFTDKGNK